MLEFKHVTGKNKGFNLTDITFAVPSGYITGITGRNGAGKTTLLNYILDDGMLYEGEILYNGIDVRKNRRWFLNQAGFISDDNKFFMNLTADTNVELLSTFYETWDHNAYLEYMRRFRVPMGTALLHMSRGEYVKFQYAFAMGHHARILIMDEATGGMDPVFRKDFFREMRGFIVFEDNTIIMTTHIQEEIEQKMDFIGIMDGGRLQSYKENIENNEDVENNEDAENRDMVYTEACQNLEGDHKSFQSDAEISQDLGAVDEMIQLGDENSEIKTFQKKYRDSFAMNAGVSMGWIIIELIGYIFALYPVDKLSIGDEDAYMFIALSSLIMLGAVCLRAYGYSNTAENGANVQIYEKFRYIPVSKKKYQMRERKKVMAMGLRIAFVTAVIQINGSLLSKCLSYYSFLYVACLLLLLEGAGLLFTRIGHAWPVLKLKEN